MRDILEEISGWYREGTRFALATVVQTWHSSPRSAGAAMAVSEFGDVVGSVSGGCVESAVFELAQDVLVTGLPVRQTYGVSDGDAFAVGLTCGGTIEMFVELVTAERFRRLQEVAELVERRSPVAIATVIGGLAEVGAHMMVTADSARGSFGEHSLDHSVTEVSQGMLAQGLNGVVHVGRHGERRMEDITVFVESFAPSPEMIVFGAIDFAAAVVRMGKFLGYHVTLCDARPVFATRQRFPEADEIVVEWPHKFLQSRTVDERTVLCVLTHDPKFDVPLLVEALRTKAAYIGAMGSRRTHLDRLDKLRGAGVSAAELERLSSPIGLDLRGRTPEETAVSIAAEIIALKWGGSGQQLRELSMPIHA
ncbi:MULTISPECIES: XdhC/CoxI family protein [Paenarthrobacter]|uniref:XdhC family protein n=1 Tax=Paenarthrobacter ureafaciens TaxID=37931 RepID=A0AAX3EMT8_PAEUR|nr:MULTISPECIES: XdhC/CoxI family protein [Paenarthrobacter]NKR13541.1 XshC-Cox1 family protein [Arthrobacter sp. M5]NKR15472.1 XshC-Cox1 family protein [Arthrobacter sp. M6]OEH59330.1 XshC-Cox1 family protein [Arthrobacter sp. D2]OEH60687.1 XshC-Cox1 family protein [Arthrobacter sp. D4]MDO5864395.1 XdhC family protein [Paenarthrobacter sp. SD-2]